MSPIGISVPHTHSHTGTNILQHIKWNWQICKTHRKEQKNKNK